MGAQARIHYDRHFDREVLIERLEALLHNAAANRSGQRAVA